MQASIHYLFRAVRQHRNAPSLFVDSPRLAQYGFPAGTPIEVEVDFDARRLTIRPSHQGDRTVSGRRHRSGAMTPVIDINTSKVLGPFLEAEPLRIVLLACCIYVLPLPSVARQTERINRLLARIQSGEPLRVVSVAHGFGGSCHATHKGLTEAGCESKVHAAIDIDSELLDQAMQRNPAWTPETSAIAAPLQEVVQDDWLLQRLGKAEILELGLPCSGASKAGKAKNHNVLMEDHERVGHLVASAIMLANSVQPATILAENVVDYSYSASASILRSMLRDMGYEVHEVVLDATDFGCIEPRVRWFLVAVTSGISLSLDELAPETRPTPKLADYLESVPLDDPSWRDYAYLKAKEVRDAAAGKGFKRQVFTPEATKIGVVRRSYNKGGSTDPMLQHPENPNLMRLLTASEHAALKGFSSELIDGLSTTRAHEALGQSVVAQVVEALAKRLGQSLKATVKPLRVTNRGLDYVLEAATG